MNLYNREIEVLEAYGITTLKSAGQVLQGIRFNASVGKVYKTMGDLCPAQAKAVFYRTELQPVCPRPENCQEQTLHGSRDFCRPCERTM